MSVAERLRLGGQPIEIIGILSKEAVGADDDDDAGNDDGMDEGDGGIVGAKKSRYVAAVAAAADGGAAVPFDAWERAARHPPVSLVHRVHCIALRALSPQFPFARDTELHVAASVAESRARLEQARTSLLDFLTSVFAGDRVSAEFFMLHIVSRMYVEHFISQCTKIYSHFP